MVQAPATSHTQARRGCKVRNPGSPAYLRIQRPLLKKKPRKCGANQYALCYFRFISKSSFSFSSSLSNASPCLFLSIPRFLPCFSAFSRPVPSISSEFVVPPIVLVEGVVVELVEGVVVELVEGVVVELVEGVVVELVEGEVVVVEGVVVVVCEPDPDPPPAPEPPPVPAAKARAAVPSTKVPASVIVRRCFIAI